ncbi:hypothetical protein MPSEU_000929000 [Mayamaea pseudoterrestris]|nr:hypothetical protein MPSEU_000929000 [Mayamaea pseudoterrestris]
MNLHLGVCHADETKDNDQHPEDANSHAESRRGLLKKLIDHYSSTPIVEDVDCAATTDNTDTTLYDNEVKPFSKLSLLTASERQFLEHLVQNGDLESIEAASLRLTDLFPPEELDEPHDEQQQVQAATSSGGLSLSKSKRDSMLQQELFRLHETQKMAPSRVLQHMSLVHRNSILDEEDATPATNTDLSSFLSAPTDEFSGSLSQASMSSDWNTFKDISTWVDGGVGVEVTSENGVVAKATETKAPFKILGTTADDVSCHPHVLSPPLMESLLAFLPESLTDFNFFLKYSLVRDGAGLWTLLRNIRASSNCFLAIETVDGHVFGAFTSQTWKVSQGWYGTKDSFLFKLRHSRLESVPSILEQVKNESEIQVYPYRPGNVSLQKCCKSGIMMGQGELLPAIAEGDHYGFALYLDPSLHNGTTGTSETFGNPCLVSPEMRGSTFEVSNIEVWTLTPHVTVQDAERAELSTMFLTGERHEKNLNLMDIIVGGSI